MVKKGKKNVQTKPKDEAGDQVEDYQLEDTTSREIKERIELLKKQHATATKISGRRIQSHRGQHGQISSATLMKKSLGEVFHKFPANHVDNPTIKQLIIVLPDRQLVYLTPTDPKKAPLWYVQKPCCFILEGRDRGDPTMIPFDPSEIPNAPNIPTEKRKENHAERAMKSHLLKKKLISGEPKLCFVAFELENEVWHLQDTEYYISEEKRYHFFFGDLQVLSKSAQKLVDSAKELTQSSTESNNPYQNTSLAAASSTSSINSNRDDAPESFEPAKNVYKNVSESNLPESDIQLIMNQANVSREKAISTLIGVNGDLVQAMMDLI